MPNLKYMVKLIMILYYYEMNFTLCVSLVYNDNGSEQTLCITRISALCTMAAQQCDIDIAFYIFTLFLCI